MPKDTRSATPSATEGRNGELTPKMPCAGETTGSECLASSNEAGLTRGGAENCRDCLGALAHRLAQTATALRGALELGLLTKRSANEYQTILTESLELADRMVQLIISLRDLAESNAPPGSSVNVALDPLVREVLEDLRGLAEARDIRIEVPGPIDVEVTTNPQRLREALQSLLAWVIQHASCGGILKIDLTNAGAAALVSIVPPRLDMQYLQIKMLEDLANPGVLFAHAAQSGTLGWAINRRFIEGLGGSLEIAAEEAGQSCVRARFPLAYPGPTPSNAEIARPSDQT